MEDLKNENGDYTQDDVEKDLIEKFKECSREYQLKMLEELKKRLKKNYKDGRNLISNDIECYDCNTCFSDRSGIGDYVTCPSCGSQHTYVIVEDN